MESFHYRSLSSQQTLWALWRGTRTTPWVLHEFFVANLKKIISVRQSQSQFYRAYDSEQLNSGQLQLYIFFTHANVHVRGTCTDSSTAPYFVPVA